MEGTANWLIGTLAVSLITNVAQTVIALIKRPLKVRTVAMGDLEPILKAAIAVHVTSCENMKSVASRLESIEAKLDRHIAFHLERRGD